MGHVWVKYEKSLGDLPSIVGVSSEYLRSIVALSSKYLAILFEKTTFPTLKKPITVTRYNCISAIYLK